MILLGALIMFKVVLVTEGLTDIENKKVIEAGAKMERVFNSEEFKKWVLGFHYEVTFTSGHLWWKQTKVKRNDSFHYTDENNQQVYDKLMSGAEDLNPVVDYTANIFLRVDRDSSDIVGYTDPSDKWQYVYAWVLKEWDSDDIAGNLAHEWCHKVGYDHEFDFTYEREYSVPYAVGDFVSEVKLSK